MGREREEGVKRRIWREKQEPLYIYLLSGFLGEAGEADENQEKPTRSRYNHESASKERGRWIVDRTAKNNGGDVAAASLEEPPGYSVCRLLL